MEVKILQDVLKANDAIARDNAEKFAGEKVFALNMMSSPGSGKTSILETTLEKMRKELRIAVIEGDIATTMDSERLIRFDIPVIQITTESFGNACHLDANMVGKAYAGLPPKPCDLLFVENVGNLVCPAGFKLGTERNVVVLSVTEGEDKPHKYPVIFRTADCVLINKVDLLPYLDFNLERVREALLAINPKLIVISLSAKTGEGFDAWLDWLREGVKNKKARS
jgi:hydrogenase nickel incorporation protein HypB